MIITQQKIRFKMGPIRFFSLIWKKKKLVRLYFFLSTNSLVPLNACKNVEFVKRKII